MRSAFIIVLFFGFAASWKRKNPFENYDPDLDLSPPQIVRRHGYPSEAHYIVTEDGYILCLHRIPYGRMNTGYPRKPVLLHHGLGSSSADFLVLGTERGLAYLLADNGYDVWLANNRGNYYSNGHVTLSYDDPKYWDFSLHEIGVYDLPASIDHILQEVNQSSLHFVGHSLGTTSFFAMASTKPEYGSKVKGMFALGPAAYSSNIRSPIRLLASAVHDPKSLYEKLGKGAFQPDKSILNFFEKYGKEMNGFVKGISSNLLFTFFGFNPNQFSMSLLPMVKAHGSAKSSTKEVIHYLQLVASGKFQQFDYGKEENMKRYGRLDPPEYNLTKIQTPVALYYGDSDLISNEVDVERLYQELPRKIGKFLVNLPGFNHLDLIYGIDAKTLVYDHLIQLLKTL